MPPPEPTVPAERGFTLVELLVAMVFVGILMIGAASVFKATLGGYVAASENLSSRRQNTLALDVLFDDLNSAGMTPTSLTSQPVTSAANPPFLISPNVPYANTNVPTAQAVGDQLFLYYDQILPYPITLGTALNSTAQDVAQGLTLATGVIGTAANLQLKFNDANQALLAANAFTAAQAAGNTVQLFLPSNGSSKPLASLAQLAAGSAYDVYTFGATTSATYGVVTGPTTLSTSGAAGSPAYLMVQAQYIRYSIQPRQLDPKNPTTYTPCLVRDVVAYPQSGAAAWATPSSSAIVASDVTGFHVGLSGDGGQTWAGMVNPVPAAGPAWSTGTAAWPSITSATADANTIAFDAQLASLDSSASATQPFWFRYFTALVRVDLTTRTVDSRTEYGAAPNTAAYKYSTRSLVITPKHFGLTF